MRRRLALVLIAAAAGLVVPAGDDRDTEDVLGDRAHVRDVAGDMERRRSDDAVEAMRRDGDDRQVRGPAEGPDREQLAFEAQIDLTYVGGIERGKRNPSLLVLVRLAKSLSVQPAELLCE